MEESKKKKKKHPFYGMAFAPIFRMHSTTPKTTSDAPVAPIAPAVSESTLSRIGLVEMVGAGPTWTGYGVPNVMMVLMKQCTPQVSGPGFQPVEPGQGGKYDFAKSPGLGFRTDAGWKVWKATMEILRKPSLDSVQDILRQAMQKSGVRMEDVDTSEMRLLEMGVEWYLSDPGRFPQPKDGEAGISGGVPAMQLTPRGL
jgi:hypothetical protein